MFGMRFSSLTSFSSDRSSLLPLSSWDPLLSRKKPLVPDILPTPGPGLSRAIAVTLLETGAKYPSVEWRH
jgi:hypothetical protein